MDVHVPYPVSDPSHAGEIRREAGALANSLGFSSSDAGRVALVATELATNIIKHAGKGVILLRPLREVADQPGLELLALDQGPGMADVARCMEDGYSTAGSPGTGLGAISRLASLVDVYSAPGRGVALLAHVLPHAAKEKLGGPFVLGAVRVAAPGESVCGDDWACARFGPGLRVIVSDGLGHGPMAADAAATAAHIFATNPDLPFAELFARLHAGLVATRGAAVSIAEVEPAAAEVRFAGIGNVMAFLAWPGGSRALVTQNGTVGAQAPRARVFAYPWNGAGLLVIHTDGLNSHTRLDDYPGLLVRHPTLVAAVLYRDFCRGRDDATVVVAGERRPGP